MKARLTKRVALQTIGILGLTGLAVLALISAPPTRRQPKPLQTESAPKPIAVTSPAKASPAEGNMRLGLRPEQTSGVHQIPGALVPVISATLGSHDAHYSARNFGSRFDTENPANHMTASFSTEGVDLQRHHAHWGMKLVGYGYDGNVMRSAGAAPHAVANRVEYSRAGLTEWYVNGPLGLEQSFLIAQAPWSATSNHYKLTLDFLLTGKWKNSKDTPSQALTLQDESGRPALRYGGLIARDAYGRELPSWLEMRKQGMRVQVDAQGAKFPVTIDPTYSEIAQLSESSAPAKRLLGISAAISDDGTVVVAGGCGYDLGLGLCSTNFDGAAYVFVEPTTGWTTATQATAVLTASDPSSAQTGDGFGNAVAISGDGKTIVVSAPEHECQVINTMTQCMGELYAFSATSEDSWTTSDQSAKLMASDGAIGDFFSSSISIDKAGDTIVARQSSPNTGLGHVNVYVRPGSVWADANETTQLEPSDVATFDNFGVGLGISADGKTVAAGSFGARSFEGEGYIFLEPTASGGWASASEPVVESAKLLNSDANTKGGFGFAAAVDSAGDTAVIGAAFETDNAGEAYVFVRPTNGWSSSTPLNETTQLKPTVSAGSAFGQQAAISDDGSVILVGSDNRGIYQYSEPDTVPSQAAWPGGPGIISSPTTIFFPPSVNVTGDYTALHGYMSGDASTFVFPVPGNNSDSGTVFIYGTQGGTTQTDTISTTSGSGQTAAVSAVFSAPLVATVLDQNGNGVSGVTVTFAAPASGASGTFAGGSDTAVTSSAGTAMSAAFTANSTSGSYTVTASAPGVTGTASFSLTNQAASIATTTTITSTSSSFHSFPLPEPDALVDGPPVVVNFTVAQTSGSVAPTGTVVVKDGFGDTCTTTTLNNGVGVCSFTTIPQFGTGTTQFTAVYTPFTGGGFLTSTSNPFTESLVEVFAPCAAFSNTVTVKSGITTTTSLTVCLAGNENVVPQVAEVTDCIPRGHCTFSVTPIPGEPDAYTVTVTIVATDANAKGSLHNAQPQDEPWWLEPFGLCGLLAMLMALQLARQNRTRLRLSCAAGLLSVLLLLGGISGCAPGISGTPAGTYTVNVMVMVGQFNIQVPIIVKVLK
ncbi:MAG: hypothetical protein WBE09_10190 [Candidatus Acidiferrales bacterium]